jgi:hypothetical protein
MQRKVEKTTDSDSYIVGVSSTSHADPPVNSFFVRTRRSKCIVNVTLEDFSRIHGQFAEKNHPSHIETPIFSLFDNDKIKFQFRIVPSKHDLRIEAFYRGSEPSGNLFVEVFLLDRNGQKFPFEYGRKVDINIGSNSTESVNNYIYDRDELEKKRDKLFMSDKLALSFDLNATWCEISDKPSN